MMLNFSLVLLNLVSCEAALRIIGGRDAINNEFPYAIRLEVKIVLNITNNKIIEYVQFCTGAAVTSRWILTAAHCHEQQFEMFARFNSNFPKQLGNISPILKVYIHPLYDEQRDQLHQNDIALFLSQNIVVSQYGKISAVDYKALVGHEVNIVGFGITNGTASRKPLQVLKGMVNKCLELETAYTLYKATMMCVVPSCGVKAKACGGDSGGPVVHPSGIVGVNTLSTGHCNELTELVIDPGTSAVVISMISHELNWISSIISH